MSLYEVADGILETHVTWQDVETNLQRNLETKARFGENKKATNISDMKGFMSRIALIEPDWVGVEDGKRLPERFIVKICSQLPLFNISKILNLEGDGASSGEEKMKKLSKLSRECHNREIEAYKLLQKFNHPDVPYTKVYALKSFDNNEDLKGYFVADFIPNVHTTLMFESIPAEELLSIVRGIATFAALGESLTAEERSVAGGPEYLDLLFEEFFDTASLRKNFDALRTAFGEEYTEKVERIIDIFWHYIGISKKYSRIAALLGFKLILSHGDLWQANMLHSLSEDGTRKLEAMIDWQGMSTMPAGNDLSRLLIGCLSTQDRRQRGKELIQLYCDTFNKTIGKEVLPFQEVFDSYSLFAPVTSVLILPGIMPFLDQAQMPEQEKAEMKKKGMEKMVGILEDILDVHDYNREHFAEFLEI